MFLNCLCWRLLRVRWIGGEIQSAYRKEISPKPLERNMPALVETSSFASFHRRRPSRKDSDVVVDWGRKRREYRDAEAKTASPIGMTWWVNLRERWWYRTGGARHAAAIHGVAKSQQDWLNWTEERKWDKAMAKFPPVNFAWKIPHLRVLWAAAYGHTESDTTEVDWLSTLSLSSLRRNGNLTPVFYPENLGQQSLVMPPSGLHRVDMTES